MAERMIQTLSSYTGEGVMFAIDTRLRPNGREGDLVQPEAAYKAYFARPRGGLGRHQLHEGARRGGTRRARHALFCTSCRRWTGGATGKACVRAASWPKCARGWSASRGRAIRSRPAPGGYYDIDFALMYLRLKGAGIFYKVLNTPERIDVIEKMGHLDREDADFLREAATFYRAIDHGQRILTGHAEGSLPTSQGAARNRSRIW